MKFSRFFISALFVLFASGVYAAPITFDLGNHAAGTLYDGSTNPYGLRYDETGQVFSIGDNLAGTYFGASATLTFDPMNLSAGAVIMGTVIDSSDGSEWQLTYTLSDLTSAEDGGFNAQTGVGQLTEIGGSGLIDLVGVADSGRVFEFDNDGHRLAGDPGVGWVGRGWFAGDGSNDFLIVGTPVPVPAALWMFGAAFAGLLGLRRRQK